MPSGWLASAAFFFVARADSRRCTMIVNTTQNARTPAEIPISSYGVNGFSVRVTSVAPTHAPDDAPTPIIGNRRLPCSSV